MNVISLKEKVIESLSQFEQFEREDDLWETVGKIIPFIRFSKDIEPDNDDFNRYQISVTVWQKNVSVEIIETCGECGPEIDSDERWVETRIFRICKVSHAEFLKRTDDLIQSGYRYLYQNFHP